MNIKINIKSNLTKENDSVQGIYAIINLLDNRMQIGETTNLYKRLRDHSSLLRRNKHHNNHLQNAYNLYGIENFEFIIIEKTLFENEINKKLKLQEIYWINFYKTFKDRTKGYNLTPGGDGFGSGIDHPMFGKTSKLKGKKLSKEHKQKMSESKKGKNNPNYGGLSQKHKDNLSKAGKGRIQNQSTKNKIREAVKGNKNGMYGKNLKNMWIDKYGIEEAEKMWNKRYKK